MESVAAGPSEELIGLRARKVSLLRFKSSVEVLRQVEQLMREMEKFRTRNPKFAEAVIGMEAELLDSFPGANP